MESKKFLLKGEVLKNGQITIKKRLRTELGIEPGDTLYAAIIRVADATGKIKYEKEETKWVSN